MTQGNFEPHNLSKKICEAIKTQKDIDSSIKGVIKYSLGNDVDIRKMVQDLIKHHIKELGLISWKTALGISFTLLLAIIGGGYFFFK